MSEQEQDQVQLIISLTNDLQKAGALAMWTVYKHPRDYPKHYVARCFKVRGDVDPTEHTLVTKSLHQLRTMLHAAGLHCLGRFDQDEAHIVETWL
jgi:hypothetical protein